MHRSGLGSPGDSRRALGLGRVARRVVSRADLRQKHETAVPAVTSPESRVQDSSRIGQLAPDRSAPWAVPRRGERGSLTHDLRLANHTALV